MLRVYEQWCGISFLGDHFSTVERGRKLCVLILVCLVSAFVGLCRVVQVCVRRLLFLVLCRRCDYLSWGCWFPCWGHWPGCGYTAGRRCLPIVPLSWLFPGTLWSDRFPLQTLTIWSGWSPLCVRIPVYQAYSPNNRDVICLCIYVSGANPGKFQPWRLGRKNVVVKKQF